MPNSIYYKAHHRKAYLETLKFVDMNITPYCNLFESEGLPSLLVRELGARGILYIMCGGPYLREYYDGRLVGNIKVEQLDIFVEFIVSQALCECGSGGVLWSLLGSMIALPPIRDFGSTYLRNIVLKDCYSGKKTCCLAITEPEAGSDLSALKCQAVLTTINNEKFYVVNGIKKFISNGTNSDFITTAVTTNRSKGLAGISLLLINRESKGINSRKIKCSGVQASNTAIITFEDVIVPYKNLIGKENNGFYYLANNLNHERLGMAFLVHKFSNICIREIALLNIEIPKHLKHKLYKVVAMNISNEHWIENVLLQINKMPKKMQFKKLGGTIALLKAHSTITLEKTCDVACKITPFDSFTRLDNNKGNVLQRISTEVRAYKIPGGSQEILLDFAIRHSLKLAASNKAKI